MGALILFGVIFIVVCFLLPIVAMTRSSAARDSVADLGKKIADLQAQLNSLRQQIQEGEVPASVVKPAPIIGEPPVPQGIPSQAAVPLPDSRPAQPPPVSVIPPPL